MLYNLEAFKRLKSSLSKRAYLILYWKFYQIGKAIGIDDFPMKRGKRVIWTREYDDFIKFFHLEKERKFNRIKGQMNRILGEMKDVSFIDDFEVLKSNTGFKIRLTAGDSFF